MAVWTAALKNLGLGAAGVLGLCRGGVVDLLQHARHRHQEGGVDLAEALDDLGGVRLVRHGHALVEAGHLQDAGEDVGQGQEDEGPTVGHERVLELLHDRHDDAAEPAVHDLAALGVACRAGGVDDRAGVLVAGDERGLLEVGVRDVGAGLGELGDEVVLDHEDVTGPVGAGGEHLAQLEVLDDRDGRVRVGEDPVALRGRGRLVDRHGDRAGDPGRPGDERPLVAGVAHDRQPVARLHAPGDEALGHALDLLQVLGAGDLLPVAADQAQHGDVVRRLLCVLEHESRQVLDREGFGGWRGGELGRHLGP